MNVDIKKLNDIDQLTKFMHLIVGCEVKLEECSKCHEGEIKNSLLCMCCESNPGLQNNFNPKQNELDKSFIGAPLMCRDISFDGDNTDWHLSKSGDRVMTSDPDCVQCRLPTVVESPRNTWLAPWVNMPKELNNSNLNVWLKIKGKSHPVNFGNYYCQGGEWKNVTGVMILEDFKR